MRTTTIFLDVFLVIFGFGLAVLYPKLILRSQSWQAMHPPVRVLLIGGWQVFLILLATNALVELLMFMQYVTPDSHQMFETWVDRGRWIVLSYIVILTLVSGRRSPQQPLEFDPRWGIILIVSLAVLCVLLAVFARSPLSLPVR